MNRTQREQQYRDSVTQTTNTPSRTNVGEGRGFTIINDGNNRIQPSTTRRSDGTSANTPMGEITPQLAERANVIAQRMRINPGLYTQVFGGKSSSGSNFTSEELGMAMEVAGDPALKQAVRRSFYAINADNLINRQQQGNDTNAPARGNAASRNPGASVFASAFTDVTEQGGGRTLTDTMTLDASDFVTSENRAVPVQPKAKKTASAQSKAKKTASAQSKAKKTASAQPSATEKTASVQPSTTKQEPSVQPSATKQTAPAQSSTTEQIAPAQKEEKPQKKGWFGWGRGKAADKIDGTAQTANKKAEKPVTEKDVKKFVKENKLDAEYKSMQNKVKGRKHLEKTPDQQMAYLKVLVQDKKDAAENKRNTERFFSAIAEIKECETIGAKNSLIVEAKRQGIVPNDLTLEKINEMDMPTAEQQGIASKQQSERRGIFGTTWGAVKGLYNGVLDHGGQISAVVGVTGGTLTAAAGIASTGVAMGITALAICTAWPLAAIGGSLTMVGFALNTSIEKLRAARTSDSVYVNSQTDSASAAILNTQYRQQAQFDQSQTQNQQQFEQGQMNARYQAEINANAQRDAAGISANAQRDAAGTMAQGAVDAAKNRAPDKYTTNYDQRVTHNTTNNTTVNESGFTIWRGNAAVAGFGVAAATGDVGSNNKIASDNRIANDNSFASANRLASGNKVASGNSIASGNKAGINDNKDNKAGVNDNKDSNAGVNNNKAGINDNANGGGGVASSIGSFFGGFFGGKKNK